MRIPNLEIRKATFRFTGGGNDIAETRQVGQLATYKQLCDGNNNNYSVNSIQYQNGLIYSYLNNIRTSNIASNLVGNSDKNTYVDLIKYLPFFLCLDEATYASMLLNKHDKKNE